MTLTPLFDASIQFRGQDFANHCRPLQRSSQDFNSRPSMGARTGTLKQVHCLGQRKFVGE